MSTAVQSPAVANFTIDKAHSEAAFQIRHIVTKVRGHFREFTGTIQFDPVNAANSTVEFSIDAASIFTDNADRDAHLRSEDFFFVEKYPTITFRSTTVEASGANEFAVTGELTMRGVTRTLTLPVAYLGVAKDPWGNEKAGFETETKLNRKDFNMIWNAALDNGGVILGDQVQISINIEAQKQ